MSVPLPHPAARPLHSLLGRVGLSGLRCRLLGTLHRYCCSRAAAHRPGGLPRPKAVPRRQPAVELHPRAVLMTVTPTPVCSVASSSLSFPSARRAFMCPVALHLRTVTCHDPNAPEWLLSGVLPASAPAAEDSCLSRISREWIL